jgi:hypothetical protein
MPACPPCVVEQMDAWCDDKEVVVRCGTVTMLRSGSECMVRVESLGDRMHGGWSRYTPRALDLRCRMWGRSAMGRQTSATDPTKG